MYSKSDIALVHVAQIIIVYSTLFHIHSYAIASEFFTVIKLSSRKSFKQTVSREQIFIYSTFKTL